MNLTTLPTRADKHRTEGLHEAAVRVGDDQLDAAEAAIAEAT